MHEKDPFVCSFCGKPQRECNKLISGPRVFICDECVSICVDVLVDERAKGRLEIIGDRVALFGTLQADLDHARAEASKLRAALTIVSKAIDDAMPPKIHIKCMWCAVDLESQDQAREHVGTCSKHPAVIALAARQVSP